MNKSSLMKIVSLVMVISGSITLGGNISEGNSVVLIVSSIAAIGSGVFLNFIKIQ